MTKRERQEARKREIQQKMCLHHFLGLSVMFENAWTFGLAGGGRTSSTVYQPVNMDKATAKFVLAQWDKILKWRFKLVQELGGTVMWEKVPAAFYRDAEYKLNLVERKSKEAWPEGTHEDFMIIETYLLYAALHDYAILRNDSRPALRYMVQTLGTLVNRLMPKDSPLVEPMNKVYWATRDTWQENPDWTSGGELEWGESEQDKYLREKEKENAA